MPIIDTERYDIDPQPIGRGGFGEAYTARDLLFDREVVIKTIVASQLYGINEPKMRHQFFREAVVAARLGQMTPNIVKVLDYGYDRDTDVPFFVMEKVVGGDLFPQVGKLSWTQAAKLTENLFSALAVAHKNGVIHSDVSPDNVLYDSANKIYKLNDFGLAKLLTSALMSRGASLSLTGGKPGYLPVEQWHTGDRDEFSDLYGATITIIHLISGQIPTWKFDFTTKEMTNPVIEDILEIEDKDKVFYASNENSFFSVKNSDSDYWHHIGGRYDCLRYASYFTLGDLVEMFSLIMNRELVSIAEAQKFIHKKCLEILQLREKEYLEKHPQIQLQIKEERELQIRKEREREIEIEKIRKAREREIRLQNEQNIQDNTNKNKVASNTKEEPEAKAN